MNGAVISDCGTYRYRLDRAVATAGPVYAFFGINPSTASATENDATVRKWIGFTRVWGGSRFIAANVSPYRTSSVKLLGLHTCPQRTARRNEQYVSLVAEEADILVPCWGDRGKVPKSLHADIDRLATFLLGQNKPVVCFGLTKGGDPKHPQMLGYNTPLIPFTGER